MKKNFEFKSFTPIPQTKDKMFSIEDHFVLRIMQSLDGKIQVVEFLNNSILMGVVTRDSYIAYYPICPLDIEYPIKAVLMDLDGTTLYSEEFWIFVIQETIRVISGNNSFNFSDSDIPFVSGHSVSEHLSYCIDKYYPNVSLVNAINEYYRVAQQLLKKALNGSLKDIEFKPAYFLKEFVQHLANNGIKVGLVTSGVYEKAYPEIFNVCSQLSMGKPEDVYNSIITAGDPLREHQVGNLGELSAKPHPWLYLENAVVGLNINLEDRKHVLGIEDSGAGVCSLLSAGIPSIGLTHGNILRSGYKEFCMDICDTLEDVLKQYFL